MSGRLLIERAPAKVNLTLHIPRRREDGWHEVESLVVFAGAADTLSLAPGDDFSLQVDGPTAQAAGADGDNLVARAAQALGARIPGLRTGAFHLTKRLPVAAGIGGGSSDAAAALRLLGRANDLSLDDPRVLEAAGEIGSDVPVCLHAQARMMRGRGEVLGPLMKMPPVFAVLVNPGVPLETKRVFARIGLQPGETFDFGKHPDIAESPERDALFAALKRARNDMEDAASVLAPIVGHCLAVLSAARGAKLARMSGSGATCFALFETCRQAAATAKVIRRDHPEWWVKATVLR
ncbi:MAG: 4-diphosphocytidyl-2-C-methyl-D-erythritol kinase [Hyphomicrobiales bacterium]|nr:4-diphosphocytidyl-2-C-methyl-D-erythritol kinase [Hyphomicrobiales bacterium]